MFHTTLDFLINCQLTHVTCHIFMKVAEHVHDPRGIVVYSLVLDEHFKP